MGFVIENNVSNSFPENSMLQYIILKFGFFIKQIVL